MNLSITIKPVNHKYSLSTHNAFNNNPKKHTHPLGLSTPTTPRTTTIIAIRRGLAALENAPQLITNFLIKIQVFPRSEGKRGEPTLITTHLLEKQTTNHHQFNWIAETLTRPPHAKEEQTLRYSNDDWKAVQQRGTPNGSFSTFTIVPPSSPRRSGRASNRNNNKTPWPKRTASNSNEISNKSPPIQRQNLHPITTDPCRATPLSA